MAIDVQHAVADDEAALNTDINTTPLVDVMLVMLIIFLVTIPVIVKTIPVQLPTYRNIVTVTKPENIVIAVDSKENMYVNNNETPITEADVARTASSRRSSDAVAKHKTPPRSAYPRRQECAVRGGGPRDSGVPAGWHPESRLHHRTAYARRQQLLTADRFRR